MDRQIAFEIVFEMYQMILKENNNVWVWVYADTKGGDNGIS